MRFLALLVIRCFTNWKSLEEVATVKKERLTFEEGFRKNSSLVVDNVDLHVYHIYMRNNGRKYLRCCTNQCPGKAIVTATNEIKISTKHTHPGSDRIVSERRFVASCKRRAETETTSLREIFNSESERFAIDPSTTFGYRESGLFKRRKSAPSNLPANATELTATIQQSARLRCDADGDQWFRAHLSDNAAGEVMLFASDLGCRILAGSAELHVEVTSTAVPDLFHQLCTVHASAFGKVFACIYALMVNHSSESFNLLLNHVKNSLCKTAAPSVVMVDTEIDGPMSAATKVFPKARVIGCLFHYTRAVWRQCVHNGLATVYNKPAVSQLVRMAVCLPLLPSTQTREGLDVLETMLASGEEDGTTWDSAERRGIRALLDYLVEHWLGEVNADRLSVYGQPRRTGSAVPQFAAGLRARMGSNPDIWSFMDKLKKIDKQERSEHQRVSQRQSTKADRNTKYMLHDRRVIQATMRLEDGTDTVQQFLVTVAKTVGSACVDAASLEAPSLEQEEQQRPGSDGEDEEDVEADQPTVGSDDGSDGVESDNDRTGAGEGTSRSDATPEEEIQLVDHDYSSSLQGTDSSSSRLTFEEGLRRNSSVVVDNVDFHIYSVYGRLRGRMYLRCLTAHCSARAVAFDGEINVSIAHTHPGSEQVIRERRFTAACKRRAELETTSLREILETESEKFNIQAPDSHGFSHKRTMYRRRKSNQLTTTPLNAVELAAAISTTSRWMLTGAGEPWFRAHLSGDEKAGDVVVFLSEEGRQMLAAATEEIQIDVIDTTVPSIFTQMCTVLVSTLGQVFPCVFALMTSKTPQAYQMLLQHVTTTLCPEMNPRTVLVDRSDTALTGPVADLLPNAHIAVTWFHYARSVWNTWRKQLPHEQRDPGGSRQALNLLKATLCLPLLRNTDIVGALHGLSAQMNYLPEALPTEVGALATVMAHVRRNWVGGVGIDHMSVFGQPRRTGNHVELFRNTLRARMGFKPDVWDFMDKLMKLERRSRDDFQRASIGATPRRDNNIKYILLDKKVIQAMSKLEDGSGSVDEFLVKAAQVIGTAGDEWIPPGIVVDSLLSSPQLTQAANLSQPSRANSGRCD